MDVEPFPGVWEESGQSAGGRRRRGSGNRETLGGRCVLLDRRRWRTPRFGGDTSGLPPPQGREWTSSRPLTSDL